MGVPTPSCSTLCSHQRSYIGACPKSLGCPCLCPRRYRSAGSLGPRCAAASQAAIWGSAAAAADDLELLLSPVRPVQQLLDEVLETDLGVGLTGSRLLQELVNLQHLPVWKDQWVTPQSFPTCPCEAPPSLSSSWDGGSKDAHSQSDHSTISLIWVCANPDGSWTWFGAKRGPGDAPGMQGGCDHLVLRGTASPAPSLRCTTQPDPLLPGLGSGPSAMEQREEDDDGLAG